MQKRKVLSLEIVFIRLLFVFYLLNWTAKQLFSQQLTELIPHFGLIFLGIMGIFVVSYSLRRYTFALKGNSLELGGPIGANTINISEIKSMNFLSVFNNDVFVFDNLLFLLTLIPLRYLEITMDDGMKYLVDQADFIFLKEKTLRNTILNVLSANKQISVGDTLQKFLNGNQLVMVSHQNENKPIRWKVGLFMFIIILIFIGIVVWNFGFRYN